MCSEAQIDKRAVVAYKTLIASVLSCFCRDVFLDLTVFNSQIGYTYYVTDYHKVTRNIVSLPSKDQKRIIEEASATPILSYHQTDFVKSRVSVEVQFGKHPFIEFYLFVKYLQSQMSSGPGYYERTLSHILRQGRGNPSVPLIMIEP